MKLIGLFLSFFPIFLLVGRKGRDPINFRNFILLSLIVVYFLPLFSEPLLRLSHVVYLFLFNTFVVASYLVLRDKVSIMEGQALFIPKLFSIKLATLFIILYYAIRSYVVLKEYGFNLVEFLIRDRVEEYMQNMEGSRYLTKIDTFVKLMSAVLLSFWFKNRRSLFIIVGLFLIVNNIIVVHNRYSMLSSLLMLVVPYHYATQKFRTKHIAVGIILAAVLMTFFNHVRNGSFDNLTLNAESVSSTFRMESSTNMLRTIDEIERGRISIDFGVQYIYFFPLSFVPRFLWEQKPTVSYFHRLTTILEGRPPGISQKIITNTMVGEAFHQLGFIGLFAVPFIWILVKFLLIRKCMRLAHSEVLIFIIINATIMDIRGGLSSVLVTFVFFSVYIYLLRVLLFGQKSDRITSRYISFV
jgi:hypothetical protein